MDRMQVADGVVALAGDLDLSNAMEIVDLPLPTEGSRLVLDLRHVGFIDSYGVTALLLLARRLDGELVLSKPNEHVARVFALLALQDLPGIVIDP